MTSKEVFTEGTSPPDRLTVEKGFVNRLCRVSADKFSVLTFTVSDISSVKVLVK